MDAVYGKSGKGRAELASRTRVLTGALRTALILVDGQTGLAALSGKLGPDALRLFDELLRAGYIERLQPVRSRPPDPAPAPPAPPPPPPRPPPSAPPPSVPDDPDLPTLRRTAVRLLAPHFGPDVTVIAQPLYDAHDRAAFAKGLDGIQGKLAVYMGKAAAAALLAPLRR